MRANGKLALVVEDDPLQRAALSELLRERDVDVVHCESAEAGEFVVVRMGPELSVLITDVVLAGKHSGLELAQFARGRLPDLKIVVVSGKSIVELPSDIHFLQKPWLPADLLRLSAV
jgi:DNA-binding NtrC family response regulator